MPEANAIPVHSNLIQTKKYFLHSTRPPSSPFLSPCGGRGEGEGANVKEANAFVLVALYPGHAPEATVKPKLLDRLREALRSRHYSRRTEETYYHWVKRFCYLYNLHHPMEITAEECLFSVRKGRIFLLPPLKYQDLIQKGYHIIARILFHCQRAMIMGRWEHSIEQSRSIECP